MTLIGKLLVLLNLILSLFFLGFAIFVYSNRVMLQDEIQSYQTKLQSSQRTNTDLQKKNEDITRQLESEKTRHSTQVGDLERRITGYEKQISNLGTELQDQRQDTAKFKAIASNAHEQQRVREQEVKDLRDQRGQLIKKNTELTTEKSTLMDEKSRLVNERDLINERNQQLAERIKGLEVYVSKSLGRTPTETELVELLEVGSPIPNVEGVVTRVDDSGKYIQLSIGEDDGLRKGHELLVWREKPDAKFVGNIEIIETKGRISVAKPKSVTSMIKPNDKVGPRILQARLN